MVPEQTIRIVRDTDFTLKCQMTPPRDMTGWAITFTLRDAIGGTSNFTKTVGSGITITDGPRGIITITIADTDTSALTATKSLADAKGYVWDIWRTDAGSEVCLARGQLILMQEVRN